MAGGGMQSTTIAAHSSSIAPNDEQFRALHAEAVEAYEDRIRKRQDEAAWLRQRAERLSERRGEHLRQAGIDVKKLEAEADQDAADLAAELDSLRDPVSQAVPDRRDLAAFRADAMIAAQGRQTGVLHAATLLAADASHLEGNDGERGNPWVLPYNPGRIHLRDPSTGSGWGCWAVASAPGPRVTFWYYLVPERSGPWYFWAFTGVHGFYILRADDAWNNCKSASAEVTAWMDVWQYGYWHGKKKFPVLDEEGDNVNRFDRIDRGTWYEYRASVGGGDPVWVAVTFELDAFANGGGSYAEVNCADGVANYLEPIALIAGPWS